MPVVINELVFKGQIAAPGSNGTAPAASSAASPVVAKADRKAIIEACVEEVMRILEAEDER